MAKLFTVHPPVLPITLVLSPTLRAQSYVRNPNIRNFLELKLRTQNSSFFSNSCTTLQASPVPVPVKDEADAAQIQNSVRLRGICQGHVPEHVLQRMEEIGFISPTDVQLQGLPVLFSGVDCILHAQTGSGKTLTYLLLIYSSVNTQRSAVQALVVVPTRELGIQVTKVARMLAAKPADSEVRQKPCSVMALLDGGTLKRHKSWIKAEPPTLLVATPFVLCKMIERHMLSLVAVRVMVVDEVDSMFSSPEQVSSLRKLLATHSSSSARQTILASASIPHHRRFVHDCIQQKWTQKNVVHVHVNPLEPVPARIHHRFMMCQRDERHQALVSLMKSDDPESAMIFVNEQSEKSKRAGEAPPESLLVDLLQNSFGKNLEVLLLEENMNINSRTAALLVAKKGGRYLLVATDLAARGVDLPETTHIYNLELPPTAVHYLHRAGRTGRKPFSDDKYTVTTVIAPEEHFMLQRYENELKLSSEEVVL